MNSVIWKRVNRLIVNLSEVEHVRHTLLKVDKLDPPKINTMGCCKVDTLDSRHKPIDFRSKTTPGPQNR